MSFTATALRLYGQPRPLQLNRIRVPFGALTLTRVNVVRLPLKRPAMRTTGNGSMNGREVSAAGSDPAPTWVPELNVPWPGPVVVTLAQVSGSVTGGMK